MLCAQDWLDLVEDRATRLRKAGVSKLEIGDFRVELHPHIADEIPALDRGDSDDPATDDEGGGDEFVPGFDRPHPDE